jgi:hypothetical protein
MRNKYRQFFVFDDRIFYRRRVKWRVGFAEIPLSKNSAWVVQSVCGHVICLRFFVARIETILSVFGRKDRRICLEKPRHDAHFCGHCIFLCPVRCELFVNFRELLSTQIIEGCESKIEGVVSR